MISNIFIGWAVFNAINIMLLIILFKRVYPFITTQLEKNIRVTSRLDDNLHDTRKLIEQIGKLQQEIKILERDNIDNVRSLSTRISNSYDDVTNQQDKLKALEAYLKIIFTRESSENVYRNKLLHKIKKISVNW